MLLNQFAVALTRAQSWITSQSLSAVLRARLCSALWWDYLPRNAALVNLLFVLFHVSKSLIIDHWRSLALLCFKKSAITEKNCHVSEFRLWKFEVFILTTVCTTTSTIVNLQLYHWFVTRCTPRTLQIYCWKFVDVTSCLEMDYKLASLAAAVHCREIWKWAGTWSYQTIGITISYFNQSLTSFARSGSG